MSISREIRVFIFCEEGVPMKKSVVLFIALMFVFAMAGCAKEGEQPVTEPESLVGYIVIDDNTLHLDEVEVIMLEDKKRMEELELTEQDMPNGYYIHSLDKEKGKYVLTDETTYTFVDTNLLFAKDADGDRLYTTTKQDEFIQHLDTSYSDSPPAQKVPFFIQVKDGNVISITEKFEFTI